ncbi:MAG: class III extradiol ring-cleavage dioxygenase [Pseudomonadota bacterium]
MASLPTFFLSHGAPSTVLSDQPVCRYWHAMGREFVDKVDCIIVISAHYERSTLHVTAQQQPPTIHDFSGFGPALNAVEYSAPGAPLLAARVGDLLRAAGFPTTQDTSWGFDHGTWVPLIKAFPKARTPVVSLSVLRGDAKLHLEIGRALAPLRRQRCLIIGSGSITHNLGLLAPPMENQRPPPWVKEFLAWLHRSLASADTDALLAWDQQAPHAATAHPSDEHLLPFFVALGAAGENYSAACVHESLNFGTLAMNAYRFD